MTTADTTRDVELTIGGMTCASCAARVEKKLNRMDGVTASVNSAATSRPKTSSRPSKPPVTPQHCPHLPGRSTLPARTADPNPTKPRNGNSA